MLFADADMILVMEDWHAARLPREVREKTHSLQIPSLPYGHPLLIRMLAERVPPILVSAGILSDREAAFITRTILHKKDRKEEDPDA